MTSHRMFAALYDRMNAPMERAVFGPRRAELLGSLTGVVLDVGAGTGANLPHFAAAERVVVAEPDPAMRTRLTGKLDQASVPVEVASCAAESLSFPDESFDAVVCTLVLCTVSDPVTSMREISRVLRPQGTLIVLEHVRSSGGWARWQDALTPVWRLMVGGCQPNRETQSTIEGAGFTFVSREEFNIAPPVIPAYHWLQGIARRT